MSMTLTLDASMLWDEYCLIEVCLAWGGRSIPLSQMVIEHGGATVAFQDYVKVLETAQAILPDACEITGVLIISKNTLPVESYPFSKALHIA